MLQWIRAWQAHTDTMRNDAAIIVRCGSWRHGFGPSLDLGDDILSTVHALTLVVVGSEDPVGGEEVARGLVDRLPRAHVEVMDDAGHLPWLDDPGRAARVRLLVPHCCGRSAMSARSRRLLASFALLALVAAGCGDDEADSATGASFAAP